MNLLLDTHSFLWWDGEPARMPARVLEMCQDRANRVLLSVASVWEMEIKLQLGKLKLRLPLATIIESQRELNGIEVLPVALSHVLELENLPAHHKDPFDRLLIAQARIEGAAVVTGDAAISKYPVEVLWQASPAQ